MTPSKKKRRSPLPTPAAPSTPRTLADVIQPLPAEKFLRSSWGKRFVHLEGPRGKFAGLMPWEALNEILTDQSLPQSQILLWRNKELLRLPASKQPRVHKLKTAEFLEELDRGATLVLNSAETCFRPLRDLTQALEAELHLETFANLYASWKAEPGFGLHRDNQHTLIVQVHGKKRWTVYPPSEKEPARSDRPLWSGTLEDGDLLHIPKGYWHFVVSVNEPSLHLTITMMPAEVGHLGEWLATQALDPSGWKPGADVPVVASADEKRRWIRRMRKALLKACTDDVIDRFIADRDAAVGDRPRLDLPALGTVTIELDTSVRLTKARLHIVRAGAERISLRAGDCTWTMSKRALPVLKALSRRGSRTLRQLLAKHDLSRMADSMRVLFQDLAKHRVIEVAPSAAR